ncbi:MAG TPA: YihY/virulence factor BrkB family protein, partial [Geodermatophilus sp.]|nr:YihY/virulence factor BrkB family protein [Geodermatophilus sp.]
MAGTRHRDSAVDRIRERVEEKAARRAAARAAEDRGPDPRAAEDRGPDPRASEPPPGAPDEQQLPGISADKPTEIPWRGWKQIVRRAWAENNADNMPIIGGGVAFFGFLAV